MKQKVEQLDFEGKDYVMSPPHPRGPPPFQQHFAYQIQIQLIKFAILHKWMGVQFLNIHRHVTSSFHLPMCNSVELLLNSRTFHVSFAN